MSLLSHPFPENLLCLQASFQSSPKVKAAMEAVDALPQLKEYFASRKVTPF
jgi:hypothetical protein